VGSQAIPRFVRRERHSFANATDGFERVSWNSAALLMIRIDRVILN
jgi:hypothetical protein